MDHWRGLGALSLSLLSGVVPSSLSWRAPTRSATIAKDPLHLHQMSKSATFTAARVTALLIASATLALAAPASPPATGQPSCEAVCEVLRIRVVNDRDGAIAVSRDEGGTWQSVGRVVHYTTQVNRQGYTASKWVPPGRVAATAVNAIHVNVGYDAEQDRGIVFSLLPRQFLSPPTSYGSFLSPDSSIYTTIDAGASIFGGGAAPLVGNRVYRQTGEGALVALTAGYVPARGEVLVIVVERPLRYPLEAVFENWEGGAVTLRYEDGSENLVGWVIRPVGGVGRFVGSLYAGVGRVRANHAGVVDVSTSPLGELGAFQIIPLGHALSPEMGTAWQLTQWMIVGPLGQSPGLWDGLQPLFYGHLRPDYRPDDLRSPDWQQRLLSRFLIEVDIAGGWRPTPACRLSPDPAAPLPDWAHGALRGVRRLRILFPPGALVAPASEAAPTSAGPAP
jgi:hypothetical protein